MSFNKQLRRKQNKARTRVILPYVAAALICEKVLKEQDGVATPVRVVDTLTFTPDTNLEEVKKHETATLAPNLQLYINLRPGAVNQDKKLEIYQVSPSGKRHHYGTGELKFSERKPEDAVQTVLPVQIKLDDSVVGTYWYEILVDGVQVTKVPLTLKLGEKPRDKEESLNKSNVLNDNAGVIIGGLAIKQRVIIGDDDSVPQS